MNPQSQDSLRQEVAKQYERWIYPEPVSDMAAAVAQGFIQNTDPALCGWLYWPGRRDFGGLRILVAGCGTHQAAYFALKHPQCQVTGVDFSTASLRHELFLKDKHSLSNLTLHQLDLCDVATLGQQFDLIISTGVLHHLPDPPQGLRALRDVLDPSGVMSLMLYGRTLREGVYLLQRAFKLAGLRQDDEGLAAVKASLQLLPKHHPVHAYIAASPDLKTDAGLVDTFLHPVDRAYSVSELMDFVESNGLKFQCWLDELPYALDLFMPEGHPLKARAISLSSRERAQFAECMTASQGVHRFVVCHAERPPGEYRVQFDDEEFMGYIPHLRHGLAGEEVATNEGGRTLRIKRQGHDVTLSPAAAIVMTKIDGKKTAAQIVAELVQQGVPTEHACAVVRDLFRKMHEWGHLLYQKTN